MIDAITLEVMWNRLIAVVNEQAAALMRTSFTTIVRESGDLSAGVFDTRGNMIAQAVTGTPGHINAMATCIHHFLSVYPADTLQPGDVGDVVVLDADPFSVPATELGQIAVRGIVVNGAAWYGAS